MRQVIHDIFDMARDDAISDKNFRIALRNAADESYDYHKRKKGIVKIIAEQWQSAIYETERDLYVK